MIEPMCIWGVRSSELVLSAYATCKHYTMLLPFKPKNWVLCNHPTTLEDVITLMEAYTSVEVGMYLIPWAWKKKNDRPAGAPSQTDAYSTG